MVFAFGAKTKSFDFPICASLQASTEKFAEYYPKHPRLDKGRQGMENFSPKGIFFWRGGRVEEAAWEEEG